MNRSHLTLILGLTAALTCAGTNAQTTSPAKPGTPAKTTPAKPAAPATTTPAKPAAPVVQGTTQLAGHDGVLGQTFTLGKDQNAINFTLKSAEYAVHRVTIGEHVYAPKANEKLLILRYTVHNPQKIDRPYGWNTIRFTAVDAKDVNHAPDNYVGRDGTTDLLDIQLKPAQKIDAFAVLAVPAAGPVPKLIVSVNDQSGVLRYDLRGKAKGLGAPFADPSDPTGASAREVVPMQLGAYAPLGLFDMKLEAVALTRDPIGGRTPDEGKRFLVATVSIRNGSGKSAQPAEWTFSTFKFLLRDADGEDQRFEDYLFKVTRDEHAEGQLRPSEEARFRIYFELPDGVAGKTLSVQEHGSRTLAFDVSSAK